MTDQQLKELNRKGIFSGKQVLDQALKTPTSPLMAALGQAYKETKEKREPEQSQNPQASESSSSQNPGKAKIVQESK